MNRILSFLKKEAMFSIAFVLALLSLFITPPSAELLLRINWKTLFLLFMLFTVLEGIKKENLLEPIVGYATRIKRPFTLSLFLILIVFVLSMFITNDVALLAFVPITITIFRKAQRKKYIIPIVVLETIAANLGSMATPFGNPQNLFLFDKMGISGGNFILLMLPLTLLSLLLLVLALLFVFRKDFKDELIIKVEEKYYEINKGMGMFYFCLFIFVLVGILGYVHWLTIFVFFSIIIVAFDRQILKKVDWLLVATFLCFFIFSAALSLNEGVKNILSKVVYGNETITGLLLSQVISNVPAAIVLEPFANNLRDLLYGVDIGGLGTVVASIASLISFRLYAKEYNDKGKYLLTFTLWNAVFIIPLLAVAIFI